MRTNIYAEELGPDPRVEIIEKETPDGKFTGLRIYLELPVTLAKCKHCGNLRRENSSLDPFCACGGGGYEPVQVRGPFMHRPGDDDSAAVTFWGKRDLREVLKKALALLDAHYKMGKTT
jgi:hypothetical protein